LSRAEELADLPVKTTAVAVADTRTVALADLDPEEPAVSQEMGLVQAETVERPQAVANRESPVI